MSPSSNRRPSRPSIRASAKRGQDRPAGGQSRRPERTAPSGKRKSVKEAAQRQARRRGNVRGKNVKRIRPRYQIVLIRAACVIALFAVIAVAAVAALYYQNDNAKYAACEEYRPVVTQACEDCGLGTSWVDCILAAMAVESGGDDKVKSVLNVDNDIMQAAEGAYGWVVTDGWPAYHIEPETTKASIYAGVLEFKQNLELWEDYLGEITPDDLTEIQLVIQGYNFGADGWMNWCEKKGVRAYSVELAREYSDTKMPAGAKGTPTHAQKWLTAYEAFRKR